MIRPTATTAAAIAGIVLAGAAGAETTLTISSWAPPTHLMTREVTQGWASEVEKVTQGRVKVRMLAKHPSAPPGAFDAVREGLVDVTFTGPNYTPARHVVTMLPELPGGGATSLANSVAYHRIYWKHLDKAGEFKGVKLLSTFTHGPGQMFNTKRAVATLADARGLKFRTGGGIGEKLAQSLGISSFVKPAPESYELLSTGVADGVFFPLESIPSFRLDSIVKHATLFPGGFYNVTFAFIMNEGAWNKLAKADQDLVLSVSGEHLARRAGKAWDAADAAAADQLKKFGVAVSEASPELVEEVRAKGAALEREWIKAVAAKGVDGAKALAEFREEIKKVAAEK
jgi:TRAP-type C4-dicarboxylate transport system substrate-binding protein